MSKKIIAVTSLVAALGLLQLASVNPLHRDPKGDVANNETPLQAIKAVADTSLKLPAFARRNPGLLVKRNENDEASSPLRISKIKMDVKVVGNIATTLMDITFYNDLNRVLDGEFCFPLGEGQNVSYFAMETEHGLREASVVKKEKGRTVYEAIVRRKVDPALLEWTAGNNFRSRIYPIPAKGNKRIVIGFEQELIPANKAYVYYQPFFFKDKVDEFSIRTEVFRQEVKPELYDKEGMSLQFDKWKENWVAEESIKNYVADKPLSFMLPVSEKSNKVFVERAENGNSAFYLTIQPKVFSLEKKLPSAIGLLWDVSGSAENSDVAHILECLSAYMKKASYPSVKLVTFSNAVRETISFSGGQKVWENTIEKIKTLVPDGGTQLGCLNLNEYNCEEFILVSDGLSNFGEGQIKLSSKPMHTICASPSADYSYLKYLAVSSGGSYVNLHSVNQAEALALLSSQHYRFISAQYDKNSLTQVFPSQPVDVSGSFSMAGVLEGYSSELVLNFGIGDKVLYTEKLTITNKPEDYNRMVPKMWAQKKLAELDVFYEKNEEEITELAQKYDIVTRNTSLLILDNLGDYITHRVVPKDAGLRKQYLAQVNESKRNLMEERKRHRDEVAAQFAQWTSWYDTQYAQVNKPKREDEILVNNVTVRGSRAVADSVRIAATTLTFSSSDATAEEGSLKSTESMALNEVVVTNANGLSAPSAYTWSAKKEKEKSFQSTTMEAEISLNAWTSDAPYMYELKKTAKENLYAKYLELKPKYKQTPSFFVDASDYFMKQGEPELALRILSNIAELGLENHQLLRVLAHRLQQLNENKLAIRVFEDILKIRGEEPQSYRDLGLAYEQNKEYQQAVDVLCRVVNRKWDGRFPEVESLVACEINHILSKSGMKLQLDSLDKRLIKAMPCDVRVVINWDTDNCDMDLWVTDPHRDKCFYGAPLTSRGGKMTRDFTGGYGPEVFMIKKAAEGKYKVEVNYYGNSNQSLTGPTTVQAELYTNYGLPNESKKVITLRLDENKEVIALGDLLFAKK